LASADADITRNSLLPAASGPLCANDDAFPRPICRAIDRAAGRRAAASDEMAYLMTIASIGPDENPDRTKTL
jgi:hypothetical protein